jgi:hypothetical protein
LLVLLLVTSGTACDAYYYARGTVYRYRDATREPLPGVDVTLYGVARDGNLVGRRPTIVTDERGRYEVSMLGPMKLRRENMLLQVSKPGYASKRVLVVGPDTAGVTRTRCDETPGCYVIDVVLEPESARPAP